MVDPRFPDCATDRTDRFMVSDRGCLSRDIGGLRTSASRQQATYNLSGITTRSQYERGQVADAVQRPKMQRGAVHDGVEGGFCRNAK
jgi:hypothetical protein